MFARRLFIYFIGFFLGCILVYFMFFKNKSRSFFPSGIVLDSLKSKDIIIETKMQCILGCYNVNNQNLKELLNEGTVIFSESSPREDPKKYVVETESPEGEEIKLSFELRTLNAKIISIKGPEKPGCVCN